MTSRDRGDDRLAGELLELRAALRELHAPAVDDAELRAQFRAARERQARSAAAPGAKYGWRLPVAAAASVALAIGAAVTMLVRVERPAPVLPPAEPPATQAVDVSAFQPLQSSPGWSPASAYSVVRVRIPLAAFAAVPGTEQEGTIEADLLVGEDGLARAIRFSETDDFSRSVADQ